MAEQTQTAVLHNYGIHKVERLPGHVGYLDIRYFYRPAWAGDTAVAAMNLVANTSALIIDLRKCPGGYPGMVTLISSYLFGGDPIHLGSFSYISKLAVLCLVKSILSFGSARIGSERPDTLKGGKILAIPGSAQ